MSGSMAPSPPVTGGRLGLCFRLGLVIAVGSIWVHSAPQGMPGVPRRVGGRMRCPICGLPGRDRGDGLYACKDGDVFTKKEAIAAMRQAEGAKEQAEAAEEQAAPAKEQAESSVEQAEASKMERQEPEVGP
jgi:hypothetical protein